MKTVNILKDVDYHDGVYGDYTVIDHKYPKESEDINNIYFTEKMLKDMIELDLNILESGLRRHSPRFLNLFDIIIMCRLS